MASGLFLTLVASAGVVVGPGTGPDKAPQRYRLDLKIGQAVDLTALGQGPMTAEVNSAAFVTLTTSDTTGGILAHVVIDSVNVTATGQFAAVYQQEMADSLRGQFIHAYIVGGKPEGAPKPSVEGNPMVQVVIPVISALFPGVGDKANSATSWSDTTRNDTVTEQGTQNTSQIIDWVIKNRSGGVIEVTGTGNGTLNAEMGGQQISGTVTSVANVTTVVGGPATASTIVSTQELSVLNPALPEPIPVRVESHATVTALP